MLTVRNAVRLLAIAALFIWCTVDSEASSGGVLGQSAIGCTCHGTAGPSAATVLTLTSSTGKFEVEPNGTLTLTFQVAHPTQVAGGLNVTVVEGNQKRGTLGVTAGQGVQVVSNEVTHTTPKAFADGKATFTFTWKAPAQPGTYTLRAAGNAVNLNNTEFGDSYNIMTQAITVGPVTGVEEPEMASGFLHLADIAPNPVSAVEGVAEIRYTLDRPATVTIELYDVTGRPVQPAENAAGDIGTHTAMIDTRRLAGGMYIAVLRAGNTQVTKHFTVIR